LVERASGAELFRSGMPCSPARPRRARRPGMPPPREPLSSSGALCGSWQVAGPSAGQAREPRVRARAAAVSLGRRCNSDLMNTCSSLLPLVFVHCRVCLAVVSLFSGFVGAGVLARGGLVL